MHTGLLDNYSRRPMRYMPRTLFDRQDIAAPAATSSHARNPVAWAREVLDFHPDPIQQRVLDPSIQRGILNAGGAYIRRTPASA